MSQDFKLFSYKKVPFNQISFDKPSQNIDGQYFSKGFYKNSRRIQIETTYLYTNNGIIHNNNKQSYINFEFDDRHEYKNKTQDFMKCINNFDQLVIDNIYSNRHKWGFTDNDTDAFSIDAIRDQYLPTIKQDFTGQDKPIIKLCIRDIDKLQIYDGLKPALLRHCIYTALRIKIYETLRDNETISSKFIIGGFCMMIINFYPIIKIFIFRNRFFCKHHSLVVFCSYFRY